MKKDAVFSPCRRYRYALWRIWHKNKPWVLFIGLNPSIADETNDDPTLIRCIHFAKNWGYGGVCMANLFAYRATKPRVLRSRKNIIGKDNDKWLITLTKDAGLVVAAWGNQGQYKQRANHVKAMIGPIHYLKLTQRNEPAHPLYLKADLTPILYEDHIKVVD